MSMRSNKKGAKLTSEEDHVLEKWAAACSEKHGECGLCQHTEVCEHLADKLIGRVHLVTQSGVTACKGKARSQAVAVC